MQLQIAINACSDASLAKSHIDKAVRFRWLNNALSSTTYDTDEMVVWIEQMQKLETKEFPHLQPHV